MEPGTQPISIGGATLKVGERVVYPNQGVCRISGIEVKEIGGTKGEFLTMKREEDGATVMVPRAKIAAIGLRHVAARAEVEELLSYLEAQADDPELDWKVRHRTHSDKMVGGSLLGTAEVLKGLHSLALLRPLPQRERELYDSARHLLVGEVAVSLGLPACSAEDTIDLCLTPPAGSPRAEAQARRLAEALDEDLDLGPDLGLDEGEGEPALSGLPAEAVEAEEHGAESPKEPPPVAARPATKRASKAAAPAPRPSPSSKKKSAPKPRAKAPKKPTGAKAPGKAPAKRAPTRGKRGSR